VRSSTGSLYLGGVQVGQATIQAGIHDCVDLTPERICRVVEAQPSWRRFSRTPDERIVAVGKGDEAIVDCGDWAGHGFWLPLMLRN
jgi:hypothetical protein